MNTLQAGLVLRGTLLLVRRNGARAAAGFAMLVGFSSAVDSGLPSEDAMPFLNLVLSVLSVLIQYWLTRDLLYDVGMMANLGPRFPAFFLLGIVSTIAIALGLIALVIPGVVLAVRWSIAGPVLLAQEQGVIDSLRRSWFYTAGNFWPIFIVWLAIYLPSLGLGAGAIGLEPFLPSPLPALIVSNACLYAGIVVGWHAGVALYSLLGRPEALSEVFA